MARKIYSVSDAEKGGQAVIFPLIVIGLIIFALVQQFNG